MPSLASCAPGSTHSARLMCGSSQPHRSVRLEQPFESAPPPNPNLLNHPSSRVQVPRVIVGSGECPSPPRPPHLAALYTPSLSAPSAADDDAHASHAADATGADARATKPPPEPPLPSPTPTHAVSPRARRERALDAQRGPTGKTGALCVSL